MTLTVQIAVLLAAAVVAVPLFRHFDLSAVLGYLVAGVVIGPWGLGLFTDVEGILHFAELGVVLLLFVIGLELQPSRLWVMRKAIFGAGTAQVVLTTIALAPLIHLLGQPWATALVIGFALSLSSTALVLQLLAERNELTTRHGRSAFAILLFQDLAIMPALVLLPLLAGTGDAQLDWKQLLLGALAVALVVGLGRHLLRPALRIVANTRVHEAFTAAALLVVVATAALFDSLGLSMALGAFIAGVLLADSEYRHELEADIEPFKGLLLGLFFIAVGMSANLGLLLAEPLRILGLTLAYMSLKAAVIWLVARLFRHDASTASRLAAVLAGGGEFAFVLLALVAGEGLVGREAVDVAIIVVTLSMAVSPLLIAGTESLVRRLRPPAAPTTFDQMQSEEPRVLIAGFGRFGQIVARVLRARRIRFTALEINQAQVDFVRRFGNKLYYGDASRLELLRAAGAEQAEVLVLAIDDVEGSLRTAEMVRRHFPRLRILARARNRQHAFRLIQAGVDEIWRETFGSSLEVAEATLVALGTPRAQAHTEVRRFREHDEQTLQAQAAVMDDEEKLIATVRASAAQLEQLFESDAADDAAAGDRS
ncbi:MAG TPA: monovalent cation:proton antiporter-2 (CPA2) family protein [Steroidobacteraceae bacterium]|nr:monovalent cation:proton antiporter-2 (CPA2) family protein [Steroidobacteraceae bacterium]